MLPPRPPVAPPAAPQPSTSPNPPSEAAAPGESNKTVVDGHGHHSASWNALKRAMHTLNSLKSRHQGGNVPQIHPPLDHQEHMLRERMSMPGVPAAQRHSVSHSPMNDVMIEPRTHSHSHLALVGGAFTQSANLSSNRPGARPPVGAMTRLARSFRATGDATDDQKQLNDAAQDDEPASASSPVLPSLAIAPHQPPLLSPPPPPPFSLFVPDQVKGGFSADAIDRGLLKLSSIGSSVFSDRSLGFKNPSSGSKAESSDPSASIMSVASRSEGSRDYTRNFPSVRSKAGSQLFALSEDPVQEEEHQYEDLSICREASIRRIEAWEVEDPLYETSHSKLDAFYPSQAAAFSFPTQPVPLEDGDADQIEERLSESNLSWPRNSDSSSTGHRISQVDMALGTIPLPPMPIDLEPAPSSSKSPFMKMETQQETFKSISSFSSSENFSGSSASLAPPSSSVNAAMPYSKPPLSFKAGASPLLLRVGSRLEQGEWMSQGWMGHNNADIASKMNPSMNQLFDRPMSFLGTAGYNSLQVIDPDHLRKVKELGRGATGRVWMAKWKGVEVALKEILDEGATGLSPANKQNKPEDPFHEARILQSLSHPCFIHLYGVVQEEGSRAMIVELVRGGSLKSGLRRLATTVPSLSSAALSPKKIQRVKASVAVQAARGMEYLHACNFVHFDLKSENLLCDLRDLERVVVKVSDLGLSAKKSLQYIEGNMRGTLPWMAPELFYQGDEEDLVTEKVDVWSFGVVLWEIWCLCQANSPYEGMSSDELMAGLLTHSLQPTSSPLPRGSPAMDTQWTSLVERCCDPDPRLRPSFTEIAERLEELEELWRKDEEVIDSSDYEVGLSKEGSKSEGVEGSFNKESPVESSLSSSD